MKRLSWIVALLTASAALAAPRAAGLVKIFDQYNATMAAGDIDRALEFRTAKTKAEVLAELKTAASKKKFQEMARVMTSFSYTVDRAKIEKNEATLNVTGSFKSMEPKQMGKALHQEMTLTYAKEGGQWKLDGILFAGNPDEVKKSPDTLLDPESEFRMDKMTSVGGPIIDTKFERRYTLITIRVLDEEILTFFPPKPELLMAGFRTSRLVPGQILEVQGHPHKTNPRKILGEKAHLQGK